jgi:predicted MFS family arabinose efflux permease
VAPWFERHQGRSITLAIMGASLGAIAGVPLLLLAVQALGVGTGLAVVAGAALVLLMPLIRRVLRHRGPAELGLLPDGEALPPGVAAAPAVVPLAARGRPRVLLWSCAVGFALALTVQIGFITHHVALAAPMLGVAGAGALVSATGLSAFAGRLLLARVVDRVSVRGLSAGAMLAQAVALALIAVWPMPAVLAGASLLYGWGIGQVTTLGPVVVRREFGAAAFGATYGAAAMLIQFSSATGPALFGLGRDAFGGYGAVLAVAALLLLLAAAVLLLGAAWGRRGLRAA